MRIERVVGNVVEEFVRFLRCYSKSRFTLPLGESDAVAAGEGKTPRLSNRLTIRFGPLLAKARLSLRENENEFRN
jgi:hypothetical protein